VPKDPVLFTKVSDMFCMEADILAVPPVNAGSAGLSTGAGHVKVTLSAGLEKLTRLI
jgi:hypothetical protein